MNFFESILMGLIQGLTEFLPVSSSGHLAIFKQIFGMKDVGIAFDVLLHVGTLIAVFVAFHKDIWELIVNAVGIIADVCKNIVIWFKNFSKRKLLTEKKTKYIKVISTPYRRFVMLILVTTIPTGIMGIVFDNIIENASKALIIPGICLLITGVLLLIADNTPAGDKDETNVSYKNAFGIGVCQGFATLPGISRSGTTIVACLVSKIDKTFAVKYSFIMSIPVILGAAVLQIPDLAGESTTGGDIASYVAGMVVAAVVGYICIKTMLNVVRKKKFKFFAYYCFAVGFISIIAFFVKK